MLAVGLILPLLLFPWWVSIVAAICLPPAFVALIHANFPPVALESFGSAADTRRAAIHFWLFAPLASMVLFTVIVIALKR